MNRSSFILLNYSGALSKLIILSILFFSSTILFAQHPLPGSYIRHTVLPGQTFKSIGSIYNVSAETLSSFNYLENYKGSVIALYLKVPLTKRNFVASKIEVENASLTPVYKIKGSQENLLLLKKNKPGSKNKSPFTWSNSALKARVKSDLQAVGYLKVDPKHAYLFSTVTIKKAKVTGAGNLQKSDGPDSLLIVAQDSVTTQPLAKLNASEGKLVSKPQQKNASITHKKFVGRNKPVVRIPSEKKIVPFIVIFILCNVLLVFVIFWYLAIKKANYFFKVHASEKIRELLTATLMPEFKSQEFIGFCKAWQTWLSSQKQGGKMRQLLINEITNGKKGLKGNAAANLVKLYEELKLHTVSLKKLQGKNWKKKIQGLHELSTMEQVRLIKQVKAQTSSSNLYVRMEAQSAMVNLLGYDGLSFLDQLRYPISEWQQIKLIDQLTRIPNTTDDLNYDGWLGSTNDSVVIFTLKLIGVFKKRALHDRVKILLHDKNPSVRAHAIKCMFEIYNEHTAAILQGMYPAETTKNKIAILDIFGTIGCEDQHTFLLLELANDDHTTKLAAANALAKCSNTGLQLLNDYHQNNGPLYKQIFLHVQEGLAV